MSALLELLEPNGAPLIAACKRYGIGSPLEQAHFFAQCAHESAGFTRLVEGLNYSSVGLVKTWPKRFTLAQALEYQHNPQRIANRVYANRYGNGDEASGDGWRYRGRGFIQTTFKANYAEASVAIFDDARLITAPELLQDPNNAAMAAGYYWIEHHCSLPAMHDDIGGVTEKINGGLNGLEARTVWLRKFKEALGVPT